MKPLFLCYERCSTCKKAAKWLADNNIEVETRAIVENNPTETELSAWIERSGVPIRRFFNTSGIKYRELGLKDKVATEPKEELIKLLSSDGMLVKRPLLIINNKIIIGFRENEYAELCGSPEK